MDEQDPVTQRDYRERVVKLARQLAIADEAERKRTLRMLRTTDPKLCAQVEHELLRIGES